MSTPIFGPAMEEEEEEIYECPSCGGDVTESDDICPHCGTEFEDDGGEDEVSFTPSPITEEDVRTRPSPITPSPTHQPDNLEINSNLAYISEQVEELTERMKSVEKKLDSIAKSIIDLPGEITIPEKKTVTPKAPSFFDPGQGDEDDTKQSRTQAIDELTRVKGLGAKRAAELNSIGIDTVQKLVNAKYTTDFIKACGGRKFAENIKKNARDYLKETS